MPKEKLIDWDSCKELDPIFAGDSILYHRIIAPLSNLIDRDYKNGLDYLIRQLMGYFKEISNSRNTNPVDRKGYAVKIILNDILAPNATKGDPGVYVPVTRLPDAICNLICIKDCEINQKCDIPFNRNIYYDFVVDVNEVVEYCRRIFSYDENIEVIKNEVGGAVIRKFNNDTRCIRLYTNEKSPDHRTVREFISTGYEYLTPDILRSPCVWMLQFETLDDRYNKAVIYREWE